MSHFKMCIIQFSFFPSPPTTPHPLAQIQVVRDKVTWPGAVIKKVGEGMPNYENNLTKGDLLITVDVDFPKGSFQESDKQGGVWGGGWRRR